MEIVDIEVKTSITTVPWEEVNIVPIGDIQYGAEGVDMKSLRRDVEWGIENNAYYIGMGDYVDVASPSNRAAMKRAGFYDSVENAIEEKAEEHRQELLKVFKGTEGRWLGLLEGHHYWEFMDGTTTDTRLAKDLGAPFLGTCGIIRVRMAKPNSKGRLTTDIWVHHGFGSGQTQAAPLNRLDKVTGSFDADIYLINHYQRRGAVPKDYLYADKRGRLRHKTKYLVATGGYMRGYTQGSKRGNIKRGSYVEQGMMAPASLGGVIIKMRPVGNQIQTKVLV